MVAASSSVADKCIKWLHKLALAKGGGLPLMF